MRGGDAPLRKVDWTLRPLAGLRLVAVRLVLVAVTWAFTALLLGIWGTHRPGAVATAFAAAYLIPINLACFWLLARALAREGSSWRVIVERPSNERALMLVVAGYPAPDARVPKLSRKALDEISTFR